MADERVLRPPDPFSDRLCALLQAFNKAWVEYCAHVEPGGLTEIQQLAWECEHEALRLRLTAAKLLLDEEHADQFLLRQEALS